jgi:hypothetical protein
MHCLPSSSTLTRSVSWIHPVSQSTTPGCSVAAYLVDRTAPAVLEGWRSEKSFSGSRFWTVDLNNSNNNLVNGHFYDVDIYLFRPKSAVGKCSPTAYGAYLEDLSTIF